MAPSAVFHIDKAPLEGSLPFLLFTLAIAFSLPKYASFFPHPPQVLCRTSQIKQPRTHRLTTCPVNCRSSFRRSNSTATTATSTKVDLQGDSSDNDDKTKKSIEDSVIREHRQQTFLDHVLRRFYQVLSVTYLLDVTVIGYRLSQAQQMDSPMLSLASAKLTAWIAFT